MRRAALLLVLILALSTPVFAEYFARGEYSVQNPIILVNYTKDAQLQTATILRTDNPSDTYVLNKSPTGTYSQQYTLTTGKSTGGFTRTSLPPGTYEITLVATDRNGVSTADTIGFTIVGLEITMLVPKFGIAQNTNFTVYLRTTLRNVVTGAQQEIATTCRYSKTGFGQNMLLTTTANGVDHTIPGLDYRGTLYVTCAQLSGHTTNKTFAIDWDETAPVIAVSANPNPVQNPSDKSAIVKAVTNEPSHCTITRELNTSRLGTADKLIANTYTTVHENREYYNEFNDQFEHIVTHIINCTNLAGRSSVAELNVTIDLGSNVDIEIRSPGHVVGTKAFNLVAHPYFYATTCSVGGTTMVKQGSDFLLAYSNVQDGSYTFVVTCTGTNTSSRPWNVTVDTTAPSLTLNATPIVCNNSIGATWKGSDANGVIGYRYTLTDGQGTLANTTSALEGARVPLQGTPIGPLVWKVGAEDRAGNIGWMSATLPLLREGNEEECGLPPFIQLTSPNYGFASSAPYTFSVYTTRAAACRYSLQSGIAWDARQVLTSTNDRDHSIQMSFAQQDIYVWCQEPNGKNHSKTFHVGVDANAPNVVALVSPNPIIDRQLMIASFTVSTDDYTYCSYTSPHMGSPFAARLNDPSTWVREHATTLDFRNITTLDPVDIPYNITCTNLAGLNTTISHTVRVHTGAAFTIARVSPGEYTSSQFVTLAVKPSVTATCVWKMTNETGTHAFTSTVNNTHSVSLGSLPEGPYQYAIDCTSAVSSASTIASFTVLRTAPKISNLTGPAAACVDDRVTYEYDVEGLDQHPLVVYGLTAPGKNFTTDDTTTKEFRISLRGVSAGAYTVKATPQGRNNLTGTAVTKSLTVYGINDTECTLPRGNNTNPAFCSNLRRDTGEEGIDCGGVCSNACIACLFAGECPTTMSCQSGICVKLPVVTPTPLPPTTRNDTTPTPPVLTNPNACTSDFQCDVDEQCRSGACVPLPQPVDPDTNLPYPAPDEGANWIAVVLIVLGLLVMGGSGYYLYEQHTLGSTSRVSPYMPGYDKDFGGGQPPMGGPAQGGVQQRSQMPGGAQPRPGMPMQQQRTPQQVAQQARREQSLEDVRARKDQRVAERKAALSAFDSGAKPTGASKASSTPAAAPTDKGKTKKKAKKKGGNDDDVFKELEKL